MSSSAKSPAYLISNQCCGSALVSMWIRIQFLLQCDPDADLGQTLPSQKVKFFHAKIYGRYVLCGHLDLGEQNQSGLLRIRISTLSLSLTATRGLVWFVSVTVNIVVDPDPVGSETFGRIRIGNNHFGSGQLRIRNEFDVKLL